MVTLTDYPPNGFLTDFMEKVKKGQFPKFDNTSKSKFLLGATFVGYLLHSRGIVHRFLAPPSFGVTENYEPILMTMSFSKNINEGILKTQQNPFSGNWTAPEVDDPDTINEIEFNDRTDVFSLGSIAYYLFTGKVPFSKNMFAKRSPADQIPSDMPESISDFIMKCWELDPKERPSMIEILNDFRITTFCFRIQI